jgi:probable HAF family extracellular repeat protein
MPETTSRRRAAAILIGTVGLLVATVATPVAAEAPSPLRIIDIGAGDNSTANGVNQLGHIVGDRDTHAFLWRSGRITDLGDLGGGYSVATDVNNRDEVVRFSTVAGGAQHAFLWRRGVMTDLGVLPGGDNSYAQAVNDRGEIVGWSATAPENGSLHAFRWRDGVMTDLGAPNGGQSLALDISNQGEIVGESGGVAVRWRHGHPQALTSQPSEAVAVDDRGDIVVSYFVGTARGFLWRKGRITEIVPPAGATFIALFGINNRTQVVGYSDFTAFVWQRGVIAVLPRLAGPSGAYDVNDRGQIVGYSAANPGRDELPRGALDPVTVGGRPSPTISSAERGRSRDSRQQWRNRHRR